MGWSCSVKASKVMDRWTNACYAQSGSSNVWEDNKEKYFFEHSRTEHRDGAITGAIWRFVEKDRVRKSGTFRINGDGTIERAPAWLKKAAADAANDQRPPLRAVV